VDIATLCIQSMLVETLRDSYLSRCMMNIQTIEKIEDSNYTY